jgi:hypothetical protein
MPPSKFRDVTLPHAGWRARPYQQGAFRALDNGIKRIALAWPRRHGKDDVGLHMIAQQAIAGRVGNYWYALPQYSQARKAIWDAVDPHRGRKRIDLAFPAEAIAKRRDHEMHIEFVNGSTFSVVGSNDPDTLVGAPPVGIVFSEYALSNPNSWAYLRPILAENGGWAVFNSTVRGRNHFHGMCEKLAKGSTDWYYSHLSWRDCDVFTAEDIARERREIAAERGDDEAAIIIAQEYESSWDAGFPGAYYARHMMEAQVQGRIGDYPHDPRYPVVTAWDIGKRDSTAVWFAQMLPNGRPRLIDILEGSGADLDWYTRRVLAKPYVYAEHLWPHDAAQERFGMSETLQHQAEKLGLIGIRILPVSDVASGIQQVRAMIRQAQFNTRPAPCQIGNESVSDAEDRAERGLSALSSYHRKWNEASKRYDDKPHHDWSSNPADALRYLAVGRRDWYDHPNGRMGAALEVAVNEDNWQAPRHGRIITRGTEFARLD